MLEMLHITRRRLACLLSAGVVLAGGIGAAGLLAAAPADAAACGTAVVAGTSCTMTGTLTLSGGTLTLTSPSALGWTGTITGLDLNLVDPTTADQSYLVDDATGIGAGWHVTVSATPFAHVGSPLPDTGTFSTNGSLTSMTDTTTPTATCSTGSTCTLPFDAAGNVTYPVAITTGATPTPSTIYSAGIGTGKGSIIIGPVGWWLNVLGNAVPGTYTSVVTMEIISGP